MTYTALARKWRPKNFTELVGQEHVRRALVNALETGRVHHAFLFTGTRGVGKTTIARIFAKCLNCEKGVTPEPCGVCAACREIDTGRFVDLIEVDAASRTKVDDTRELLDNVQYSPTRGRYKVYLIDEVHMLSTHSFNALLKTLEEPPPHVKFLLATTDPQKLPVTVLSRCLQFNLKRMPVGQIAEYLKVLLEKEGVPFEPAGLRLVAQAADGSMRDGLSLLDQLIAFGGGKAGEEEARAMLGTISRDHVERLAESLGAMNVPELMKCARSLDEFSPDYAQVLEELSGLLVRVAMKQTVSEFEGDDLYAPEVLERLAKVFSPEDIQLYYQTAIVGRRDLALAPDPRTGFEMTLLRMIAFRPAADAGVGAGGVSSGTAATGAAAAAARAPAQVGGAAAAARAAAQSGTSGAAAARAAAAAASGRGGLSAHGIGSGSTGGAGGAGGGDARGGGPGSAADSAAGAELDARDGGAGSARGSAGGSGTAARSAPVSGRGGSSAYSAPVSGGALPGVPAGSASGGRGVGNGGDSATRGAAGGDNQPAGASDAGRSGYAVRGVSPSAAGGDAVGAASRAASPSAGGGDASGARSQAASPSAAGDTFDARGQAASPAAGGDTSRARSQASAAGEGAPLDGSWAAILQKLDLQGAARQLASHCMLQGRQGAVVRLAVDPRAKFVRTTSQEEKLAQSLSRFYGETVRLEFTTASADVETPAQAEQRASQQELEVARQAFETDPGVQVLRERFGATLLPDTVRPVK